MIKPTHPKHRLCEEQRDVAIQTPLTKNAFTLNPLARRASLAMPTPKPQPLAAQIATTPLAA
jgi:hypothetical protein